MKKQIRPSKLDIVREQTAHDYRNNSTASIMNRRAVLAYEVTVQENAVVDLVAQVAASRKDLGQLKAQVAGLAQVLGKR